MLRLYIWPSIFWGVRHCYGCALHLVFMYAQRHSVRCVLLGPRHPEHTHSVPRSTKPIASVSHRRNTIKIRVRLVKINAGFAYEQRRRFHLVHIGRRRGGIKWLSFCTIKASSFVFIWFCVCVCVCGFGVVRVCCLSTFYTVASCS